VHESIVEAFPEAPIRVMIVWTDRMSADDEAAAKRAVALVGAGDSRVAHFYEGGRAMGEAVATTLGWPEATSVTGAAWDIYLFWRPGVRWTGSLPAPQHVFHQLGMRGDDPAFVTGAALAQRLRETTQELIAAL
jgi:hypothetical protein